MGKITVKTTYKDGRVEVVERDTAKPVVKPQKPKAVKRDEVKTEEKQEQSLPEESKGNTEA